MGRDHRNQDLYAWDNEFGSEIKVRNIYTLEVCFLRLIQDLKPFAASQMLVSNAEFLEFVEAGGYTEEGQQWWSKEGWRYVQDLAVSGPRFWVGRTHCRMLTQVN